MEALFKRQWFNWILLCVWMGIIFFFSSQPRVAVTQEPFFNFLFFKTLHLGEYGILFLLWQRALKGRSELAALCSFLYALSDEWHQRFVPTREGCWRDVFIDALGILIAWWMVETGKWKNSTSWVNLLRKTGKSRNFLGIVASITIFTATALAAEFRYSFLISGNVVRTGRVDLVLEKGTNLGGELQGEVWGPLTSFWEQKMWLFLKNAGNLEVEVSLKGEFKDGENPLLDKVTLEVISFIDSNLNDSYDPGEEDRSLGQKTLAEWLSSPFVLGKLAPQRKMGLILRFFTQDVPDELQAKKIANFDFVFEARTVAGP